MEQAKFEAVEKKAAASVTELTVVEAKSEKAKENSQKEADIFRAKAVEEAEKARQEAEKAKEEYFNVTKSGIQFYEEFFTREYPFANRDKLEVYLQKNDNYMTIYDFSCLCAVIYRFV